MCGSCTVYVHEHVDLGFGSTELKAKVSVLKKIGRMGLSCEKVTELYYESTWHWVFVGIHILKSQVSPQTPPDPIKRSQEPKQTKNQKNP